MTPYHHSFTPWRARNGQRVVSAESHWKLPLRWNRAADKAGERRRVEVACDVFEDWQGRMVDASGRDLWMNKAIRIWETDDGSAGWAYDHTPLTMQDVRSRLFALIDATQHLDWLLLTKRPENLTRMLPLFRSPGATRVVEAWPRHKNVWLGTSVENQQAADERIPHLLRVPAAVRFLSVEPLLGPVDLRRYGALGWWRNSCPCGAAIADSVFEPQRVPCQQCGKPIVTRWDASSRIDWVIVGGESGHGARPCDVSWIRSVAAQCKAAGVACFVKQLGSDPVWKSWPVVDARAKERLRDKKGGDWDEWPDDLRVREFPNA